MEFTSDILNEYIEACQCPWCNDGRKWRSLAAHCSHFHSISAAELREMAGLNRGTSICDPELHVMRREQMKAKYADNNGRPPSLNAFDVKPPGYSNHPPMRPEGKRNQLAWLCSERQITQMKAAFGTPARQAKKLYKQRHMPTTLKKKLGEQVKRGLHTWLSTHTKEEIHAKRLQAGLIVKEKLGPNHYIEMSNLGRAKQRELEATNPEWVELRRAKLRNAFPRKINTEMALMLKKRHDAGESTRLLAQEFGFRRRTIDRAFSRLREEV